MAKAASQPGTRSLGVRRRTRRRRLDRREGLRRAGVRAGAHLLDVRRARGLSIPAARLGARVVSVDQSPSCSPCSQEGSRENLAIETRVWKATRSRSRRQLRRRRVTVRRDALPRHPKAIREMARVLKPAGRIVVNAYGDPHRIEFLGFFVKRSAASPQTSTPTERPCAARVPALRSGDAAHPLTAAGLNDAPSDLEEATEFRGAAELGTGSSPATHRANILGMLRITATSAPPSSAPSRRSS